MRLFKTIVFPFYNMLEMYSKHIEANNPNKAVENLIRGGVKIGDNVFIGYGSIILPGTHIGNNVIIGAGAVVRGEIPEDSVVIGNPGHIVCKTSDYIAKNKADLNDFTYYDMNNSSDVEKMNPLLKKGFIE